jgi:hypothetical protein
LSWLVLEIPDKLGRAKYVFAITAHLLKVLGEIATGYNIGCKFGKMV